MPHAFRFGCFEFRPTSLQLHKRGALIKIDPQAARLLEILLEHPNELVTYDAIWSRLWTDTAVDYGQGTRRCLVQLRQVLGDGPVNPIYIRTERNRGYVFVAPVLTVPLNGMADGGMPEASPSDLSNEKAVAPTADVPLNAPTESYLNYIAQIPDGKDTARTLDGRRQRDGGQTPTARRLFWTVLAAIGATAVGLLITFIRPRSPGPLIQEVRQLTFDGLPKVGPVLTNGSRIYCREQGTEPSILVLTPGNGPVERLHPPISRWDAIYSVSRDNELLLLSRGILWRWFPGASIAHRVSGPLTTSAAYLGNDQAIRAVGHSLEWFNLSNNSVVHRVPIPLANTQTIDWIRVSPDGQKIRFLVSDRKAESRAIWEIGHDASNLHLFLDRVGFGSWASRGRWYIAPTAASVYSEFGDLGAKRERSGLFTRGSELKTLTYGGQSWAWPTDAGESVIAIGQSKRVEAVRLNIATRIFADFPAGPVAASDLDYSRDGRWIAYVDDFQNNVWIMNADGSGNTALTKKGLEAHGVHWSPDGKEIAFMGRRAGGHWQVYIVAAAGEEPEAVHPDDLEQGIPTWSKDGRYLVFGERRDQRPATQMRIHCVDRKTRQMTELPDSAEKWTARWSPDGRYILAQSTDWHQLYLFEVAKRSWLRLGRYYNDVDQLAWSPDSRYVYCLIQSPEGEYSLIRLEVYGQGAETLLMSYRKHPELDHVLIGITPDGSPVLPHVIQIQELFAIDVKWPK
jgi:DNA-binding winged helix-turn-helix (wHTH) protein